ncbi:MAG TPA: GH25 family lysozyme [Bacillota bacterium]|nr:GH25 family lysozyme [Bacillota bacterium]
MKLPMIFWPAVVLVLAMAASLVYNGYLWPNAWFAGGYSVQGIDVSHHQNQIDWSLVSRSGKVKFAYIKATEGQDFTDHRFTSNWTGASEAGVLKGAYHYFTITSSGIQQARHFIATVPPESGCLAPMVDIEESGLTKIKFKRELTDFIKAVEAHYGQKPVIYVVYPLYEQYIKGEFTDCPIWIRDVVMPPHIPDQRKWVFWQYSHRGHIPGIPTFVDLNVVAGDGAALRNLIHP